MDKDQSTQSVKSDTVIKSVQKAECWLCGSDQQLRIVSWEPQDGPGCITYGDDIAVYCESCLDECNWEIHPDATQNL